MEEADCGRAAPPGGNAHGRIGPSRERAIIAAGLALGMMIAAMEGTVVSTAMPTVIGDLKGIRLYPWVFSAYLLTSATTVPIYGKLADLYGRRRMFLIAVAVFLLGSVLSGAAQTMPQLIAFRALQGLGAGGVLPLTLTIIGDLYDLRERARVQGLFTSIWGTASLAGPIIGAFLTEQLSWRWVFFINVPVGLLAAFLVGAYLRESGSRATEAKLDIAGMLLLTGSVVALLTLLTLLAQAGQGASWRSAPMLGLAALTVALVAAFLRQEQRAADPMLPLTLFRHPVIAACTVGNLLIGLMMYAVETYMPLFMQGVRGGTAHSAGVVLTPLVLFWSVSAYLGARALVRFGFRATGLFGVSCILAAAISIALTTAATPAWVIFLTMTVLGCGLGPSSLAFLITAQNVVPWHQRGVVTASSQFFRTISGTVGVGLLGTVLNARMASTLHAAGMAGASPNVLLNAEARAALLPADLHALQAALAQGLRGVFLLQAAFALACFLGVLRIAFLPEAAEPASSPAPGPAPGAEAREAASPALAE